MKTREIFLCTIDKEDGELVTFRLAPVDFCALLELADDMESFGGENDRTLRRMGVVVDSWASCARRIREALGVFDD